MRKLLSFLAPLIASTGCGDCVPVEPTPDERAWVEVYRPGQQITFRSNRGATNVLTMQPLKEMRSNQDCNKLESGKYQPLRLTLVLQSATNHGGPENPSWSLQLDKTSPERPATLLFNLAGLLGDNSDVPGGKVFKLLPAPVTLSNGRSFPAAYAIRNGQNAIYLRGSQLRAAYWDQRAGLLRYELESGEVFDLAN
ncbi:hypothetical protein [Hymenobacter jeollabukensis]|uniref:Lipoprotein n=1 Tax=Hymenobacter jeollabukensis TaxID=2025313 RepID=A0A5R8WNA6_9BACT|nr:hypothetical protein [Hymenobacter jeollabukensis]TLM90600.1 hypothetical protein FDY95_17975 [Hymenobacter jeollabukensis]